MSKPEKLQQFGMLLHTAGAVAALAVAGSMYWLIFLSLQEKTAETKQDVAAKRRFLESAQTITSTHSELKKQLRDEESRLADALERIPPTPQESDFLAQLARLARDCSVSIRQFNRGGSTEEQTHSGMEVQLSADASYASICRFLAGLARLRRLCHVRELHISADQGPSDSYPVEMTLRIFYAPLREAAVQGGGTVDG